MTGQHREVEHEILMDAPAAAIYRLLAEAENWPRIFPPTIHVERLEGSSRQERIQIWATGNGEPKTWTSRRTLDPETSRIHFRQEVSAPPVAAMGGTWLIERASGTRSRVRLVHQYSAVGGDRDGLAWIDRAVDENSRKELAALKAAAESARDVMDELTMSFEDAVLIDGDARDAYDFVNDAGLWGERLPHVVRVDFEEKTPGLQVLAMDTRAVDGSTHTTKSVRVCFPHSRVVYKQVTLPALLSLHTGEWRFEEAGSAVTVVSRHTVAIRPESIAGILGDGAGVPHAREFVRNALSENSLATLRLAKAYAESRR